MDDPLKNINGQLENIYTGLTNLQGAQLNAVTNQSDVMNMMEGENTRLLNKQQTIDQAVENQKRIIYFNDNSRKISSAYLYIVITIVATLGMIFLLRLIYFYFGAYLPNMLFNILMAIFISGGLIVIYNIYKGIQARDHYNFDELNLNAPSFGAPGSTPPGSGLNINGQKNCIGRACCTDPTDLLPGTVWDSSKGLCVFAPPTGPSGTSCPYTTPTSTPTGTMMPTTVPPMMPTTEPPMMPTTVPPTTPPIQAFTLLSEANEAVETGYQLL